MTKTADDTNPMPLMGKINRAFARLVDAPLAELGMAMSQLPVLMALGEHGALPQSELVKIARVEQSSMAQLLSRMERDGLITRVPDPADGRSKLIRLTDQAIAMRPKGRAVMEATSERGLAGLSKDERVQLGVLLARILENLEPGDLG
jgi:DNA-binding MarR family transcriptional regulator